MISKTKILKYMQYTFGQILFAVIAQLTLSNLTRMGM